MPKLYRPAILRHPFIRRMRRYRNNPTGHSVKGTKVSLSYFGADAKGVIEEQHGLSDRALFKVRFDKPLKLDDLFYAPQGAERDFQFVRFTSGDIEQRITIPLKAELSFVEELRAQKCLGVKDVEGVPTLFVVCGWALWKSFTIKPDQFVPGKFVQMNDSKGRSWAVIVAKYTGKVVTVWFPEPVHFEEIQSIFVADKVKPTYISKDAYFINKTGYDAMRSIGIELPPVEKFKDMGIDSYAFKEPIPIKKMAGYINELYKHTNSPYPKNAVWYSLLKTVQFNMAPIDMRSVSSFTPLAEDRSQDIWIVPEGYTERFTGGDE